VDGIAWCRNQQMQALKHVTEGHECSDPGQCTPLGVRRWISDVFFEELEMEP
jgi:hypothetical protein